MSYVTLHLLYRVSHQPLKECCAFKQSYIHRPWNFKGFRNNQHPPLASTSLVAPNDQRAESCFVRRGLLPLGRRPLPGCCVLVLAGPANMSSGSQTWTGMWRLRLSIERLSGFTVVGESMSEMLNQDVIYAHHSHSHRPSKLPCRAVAESLAALLVL
ncbi:hypothetical protein BDY19DRAFT_914074 [Irpex rosettiformis]|uniref:Uncharacterized protein n=1 Tax=Irpex rosettiformis TaxID=378272 RepID=A0ACB8UJX2_9APHY|nr:hypothetical protein BDY19DRAFT_914074 [Irpex rosettiformis]